MVLCIVCCNMVNSTYCIETSYCVTGPYVHTQCLSTQSTHVYDTVFEAVVTPFLTPYKCCLPVNECSTHLCFQTLQNYLFTLAGDLSTTPYASGGVGHNTGGPGYSTIPEATTKATPQVDSASSERYTGLPELQGASSSSRDSKGNREVDAVDLVSFAHQIASGMVSYPVDTGQVAIYTTNV